MNDGVSQRLFLHSPIRRCPVYFLAALSCEASIKDAIHKAKSQTQVPTSSMCIIILWLMLGVIALEYCVFIRD